MALTYEFLTARAEQAAQEAACALLENVRIRALRSEAAWREMATQVLEGARARETQKLQRDMMQLAPSV